MVAAKVLKDVGNTNNIMLGTCTARYLDLVYGVSVRVSVKVRVTTMRSRAAIVCRLDGSPLYTETDATSKCTRHSCKTYMPPQAHPCTQLVVTIRTPRFISCVVLRLAQLHGSHRQPALYPTSCRALYMRVTSSKIEVCAGPVPDAGFSTSERCASQDEDAPLEFAMLRPKAWVYCPVFLLPCSMPELFSGATTASEVDDDEGG